MNYFIRSRTWIPTRCILTRRWIWGSNTYRLIHWDKLSWNSKDMQIYITSDCYANSLAVAEHVLRGDAVVLSKSNLDDAVCMNMDVG